MQPQNQILMADIIASCQQILLQNQQQNSQLIGLIEKLSEIDRLQEDKMASIASTKELSPPIVEPKSLSTRLKINRLVRDYATAHNITFRDTWRLLYTEFRDRYHINLRIRARNNGKLKPLDICEQLGMIEELYAVASNLFASRLPVAS
ncbi:hypothetical protein [Allocoleopsis sp.]|uniref:hypothetical protein n=1 Tax=Allocoleopsis sp. TaxID=3088169 RepID=UPI002FD694BA